MRVVYLENFLLAAVKALEDGIILNGSFCGGRLQATSSVAVIKRASVARRIAVVDEGALGPQLERIASGPVLHRRHRAVLCSCQMRRR